MPTPTLHRRSSACISTGLHARSEPARRASTPNALRGCLALILLFAMATSLSAAGAPPVEAAAGLHDAWTQVLRGNIRNERVDYATIKAKHKTLLRGYLDALAKVQPESLSRDERLAFYINLYNATMVSTVIDRYRPDYTPSENEFAVFDEPLVRTTTGRISLNALENEIIRPQFNEPRIHVALVCGAVSCPPLVDQAYTAQKLDTMLDANMRRFLTDGKRNQINLAEKRLVLSKLFEWYAEDFGGAEGVARYFDAYVVEEVADWSVGFQEYSWALNDTR